MSPLQFIMISLLSLSLPWGIEGDDTPHGSQTKIRDRSHEVPDCLVCNFGIFICFD